MQPSVCGGEPQHPLGHSESSTHHRFLSPYRHIMKLRGQMSLMLHSQELAGKERNLYLPSTEGHAGVRVDASKNRKGSQASGGQVGSGGKW